MFVTYCNSLFSPLEEEFKLYDNNNTEWAKDACTQALSGVMSNKFCRIGLGEHQEIFMYKCMEDVIKKNDASVAHIMAESYIGVCRYTLVVIIVRQDNTY